MNFSKEYDLKKENVEKLIADLAQTIKAPAPLDEAMRYSLLSGGKRLRPILLLEAYRLFAGEPTRAAELLACAVECVHTYSLIHDDLPCMDDDDLRRGKPTSHKVFGEAMAVLAGDALLNLAYELIFEAAEFDPMAVKAGKRIADAIGSRGLIAGQTLDIAEEEKPAATVLRYIYQHKTADLISAALLAGAILTGADDEQLKNLKEFGDNYGFAFQLGDDVLDYAEKTEEKNFVSMYGLDVAKTTLVETVSMANAHLNFLGKDCEFLKKLAQQSVNRKV